AGMKNKAGKFVDATFESVSAAADGAATKMPADLRVSITDAEGKNSYPISGFTWLLVYKNMKDEAKAGAFVKFLRWALSKGQSFATELYYAPLPKAVVKMCEKNLSAVTANGKKIK
ncbi:MAG: phosphate ABC transporter substrate-binding protein PstS, partial [Melioribacteraceae bacterium]